MLRELSFIEPPSSYGRGGGTSTFYGDVPLALVKGRERTYLEHFWNDFTADRTRSVPEEEAPGTVIPAIRNLVA